MSCEGCAVYGKGSFLKIWHADLSNKEHTCVAVISPGVILRLLKAVFVKMNECDIIYTGKGWQ